MKKYNLVNNKKELKYKDEFQKIISEIIDRDEVQSMSKIPQHRNTISCLEHSIFVSYTSFRIARMFKTDTKSAAKAGLLHDFHLRNRFEENIGALKHVLDHSEIAASNASMFDLTKEEEAAIRNHMWPMNITKFPKGMIPFIVNLSDKICATLEMSGVYKILNEKTTIGDLNKLNRSKNEVKD